MVRVTVERQIQAPVEAVFQAVTDLPNLPETMPEIVDVEFLTEQTAGIGTRFRESRRMGKRVHVTELEVIELVANEHTRMVADSGGTIWDTTMTVRPVDGGGTSLEIAMDCRGHTLVTKIMNPVMKGLFRKGLDTHIDAVKAYCERGYG